MPNKLIRSHKVILDVVSELLSRDVVVQEFLREYNRNRGKLMQYLLEDIINHIDQIVEPTAGEDKHGKGK